MRQTFIILTIILFFGCKTETRETIESYPNGKVMTEYIYSDKANLKDYSIIEYFENGKTKFKGTVKNGKFINTKINYYDNGNYKEVDSIINPCDLEFCCCDGKVFKYFRNGKLDQTYEIRNGVANGLLTIYDRDSLGKVIRTTEYKNDKKNGRETVYSESGNIYSISEFKNDTAINNSYYFKENGDTLKPFPDVLIKKESKKSEFAFSHHALIKNKFPFDTWLTEIYNKDSLQAINNEIDTMLIRNMHKEKYSYNAEDYWQLKYLIKRGWVELFLDRTNVNKCYLSKENKYKLNSNDLLKIFSVQKWAAFLIEKNKLIIKYSFTYPNGNQTSWDYEIIYVFTK